MSLNIGDVIDGKYRIVRLLGEGGMGSVYEGENLRIRRQVAIKILHSSVAESADAVQRFEREAQAAGRIGSDHIVEVLDLGDLPDGDRYMVMEFLDGEPLSDRIGNTGALPARDAARIVVDMLEGLAAAHEAGIIHRDLKPENVFLIKNKGGKKDFVKIVDFGISKFSSLGGEFSMTRTGAVMGTPYYLSPEQAKGDRSLDHRADLYAVGVILYEAVAGCVPFDGETFNELLFKIVLEPVKPLSAVLPDVDPAFSNIVARAMERDPNDRFQSAVQLKSVLEMWLDGQPVALQTISTGISKGTPAHATAAESMEKTTLGVASGLTSNTAMGPQGVPPKTVTKTHGAWANTNPEGAPAPNGKKWGVVAAAVILVAGGGFFAMQSQAAAEEAAAAAARAEAESEAEKALERERLKKLVELEAEKALAEAKKAEAEKARLEAEKRAVEMRLSAVEQHRLAEEKAREEKARAQVVRTAPRPGPLPAPKVSPKPAGRKFRTDI